MRTTNYSSFRANLKSYLDDVEQNDEILVLNRGENRGTVILSLSEYNALKEANYLLSSQANVKHLKKSMKQADEGKTKSHKLID